MNIPMFVISLIVLLYSITLAYFSWIKPNEFTTFIKSRREKIKGNLLYRLQLPLIAIFSRNPKIDLYGIRIGSLFLILFSLLLIFVAFHGPFVGPLR